MEFKYTNFNGEIVLAYKPNYFEFFLIVKIELKNESYRLFFEENALIA